MRVRVLIQISNAAYDQVFKEIFFSKVGLIDVIDAHLLKMHVKVNRYGTS